jgi:hydroxypyruvate reductase 1
VGKQLQGKTLGVIGAGRIGSALARMMIEGHKMSVIYFDPFPNPSLESFVTAYNRFLISRGEPSVTCRRAEMLDDVFNQADCISIHTALDESTHHLIGARELAVMKPNAVLVNTSRGPVINEQDLVAHCRSHPDFRAGLDVFEDEPGMKPGLAELENVVLVPHIASATGWTRQGMAILAATNVAGVLMGFPAWRQPDISDFLGENPPQAAPSLLNAGDLDYPVDGSSA